MRATELTRREAGRRRLDVYVVVDDPRFQLRSLTAEVVGQTEASHDYGAVQSRALAAGGAHRVLRATLPPGRYQLEARFAGDFPGGSGRSSSTGSLRSEVTVAEHDLQISLPLRQPDPHLRALLDDEAVRLLQQLPATSAVANEVQTVCAKLLPDTSPRLDTVARSLHRSPRTLQRQLQQDGLQFQTVVDDTRRQLANGYLQDPHLTLTDIAGLLGYAEQSAFTRAYRRWTGSPPNRARRRHPGVDIS